MPRRLLTGLNMFRRREGAAQPQGVDDVEPLAIDRESLPSWTTGTSLLRTVAGPISANNAGDDAPNIKQVVDGRAPMLPQRRFDRWE